MEHFRLDKVLNISPTEYCASLGKQLSDYEFKGVYAGVVAKGLEKGYDINELFLNRIPEGTEVVVNYRRHNAIADSLFRFSKIQTADGTALIPKKK